MNWGDLTTFPFLASVWGTAAAWFGAVLSTLTIIFGVGYYVLDRRREHRGQATLVDVSRDGSHVVVANRSDKDIIDVRLEPKIMSLWKAGRLGDFQGTVIMGSEQPAVYPSHQFYKNSRKIIRKMKQDKDSLAADIAQAIKPDTEPVRKIAAGLMSGGVLYFVTFRDAQGRRWSINVLSQKLKQIKTHWWVRLWRWTRGVGWACWWVVSNEVSRPFRWGGAKFGNQAASPPLPQPAIEPPNQPGDPPQG